MNEILLYLEKEGNSLVKEIQDNLARTGSNATGETSKSIRLEVKRESSKFIMRIIGRPYFFTVETGRKPTPDKKPSRSMIENIKGWVKARRLDESLVWAIATEINKKGTKLFRQGGRKDIVSNVITPTRLQAIERGILEQYAKIFVLNVKNLLNGSTTKADSL